MSFSNLPARLRYLQQVFDSFEKRADNELIRESDTSLLESLVRQRVDGLTKTEANQVLEADRRELVEWSVEFPSYQSLVYSIIGEMIGVEVYSLGSENVVESLSVLLSNMPSPPPGREFGPLPEIKPFRCDLFDENGNVFLYLRSNASYLDRVDLRVSIDGIVVVWDAIEWHPNIFTRYRLRLGKGEHDLIAESQRGQARLEKSFSVGNNLHIGITYWYSEPSCYSAESPPKITFYADEKPWIPDYDWK